MSEERKGMLTNEQESFLANLLDETIQFKNPLLESMDSAIFKVLISVVDNNLVERIPQEWQNPLEPIIDAAIAGDWEGAADKIANFANEKIDIPGLDEISEQMIFTALVQLILGLIMGKIEQVRKV